MLDRLKRIYRARRVIRQNVEVGTDFSFGENTVVWAPRSLSIGNNVALGSNVRIEVDGVVGDHVLIANSSAIVGREDHDRGQVGVSIRESRWVGSYPEELSRETHVGSDVWIGFGSIVLSGVTIGDSTIVGAGSVVTKDLPPNVIAVGNPARVIAARFAPDDFDTHWDRLTASGVRPLHRLRSLTATADRRPTDRA